MKKGIEIIPHGFDDTFSVNLNGEEMWFDTDMLDDLIKQLSDLKDNLEKSEQADKEREKLARWQGVVK